MLKNVGGMKKIKPERKALSLGISFLSNIFHTIYRKDKGEFTC
jgi:hypothetical protein